uniref:Uncharacterized protein n=1 Tax=Arundo donax TaxID=35708 RepID=A0A0A8YM04_ARUDO
MQGVERRVLQLEFECLLTCNAT